MKRKGGAGRTCIVCRDDEHVEARESEGEAYDACGKCYGDRFRRAEAERRAKEKRERGEAS